MIRRSALLAAFLGLAFAATAADPTTKDLVGKWKMVKSGENLPPGLVVIVDFEKEDKLKLTIEFMDKKESIPGTWKLDGKNIKITLKEKDKEEKKETLEINKLEGDDLITKDEKGKLDEFKKVKEEKK